MLLSVQCPPVTMYWLIRPDSRKKVDLAWRFDSISRRHFADQAIVDISTSIETLKRPKGGKF